MSPFLMRPSLARGSSTASAEFRRATWASAPDRHQRGHGAHVLTLGRGGAVIRMPKKPNASRTRLRDGTVTSPSVTGARRPPRPRSLTYAWTK